MKKEENYFEALVAFALAITLSIFVTIYEVYVLMKFIKWYNIPLSLSFKQIFGIITIISLISIGWTKADENKDKSIWYRSFNPSFMRIFLISFMLFIYYILTFFI